MNFKTYEVPHDRLRWDCDPSLLGCDRTKGLVPLRELLARIEPYGPSSLVFPWIRKATTYA